MSRMPLRVLAIGSFAVMSPNPTVVTIVTLG